MSWSDLRAIGNYLGITRNSAADKMHQQAHQRLQRLQGHKVTPLPKIDPQPAPQNPSLSTLQKVTATTSAVIGVTTAASAAYDFAQKFTPALPTEAVKSAFNATVNAAANATPQPVQKAGEVLVEGSSGLWNLAKFSWSWGSWGFGFLPPEVKLLLTIGAGIFVYKTLRGNRGCCAGNNTMNLHLNLVGSDTKNCRMIQSERKGPNGKEVHVELNCKPEQAPDVKPLTPKQKSDNYIERMAIIAQKTHAKLEFYQTNRSKLLSKPVNEEIQKTLQAFDEMAGVDYKDKGMFSLFKDSQALIRVIEAELATRKKEVIQLMIGEAKTRIKAMKL